MHQTEKSTTQFIYVLIALMLCQSFLLTAKTLDFHVIDLTHHSAGHSQTEHDQLRQVTEPTNDIGSDAHNTADCHHCGHCHGTHIQWLNPCSTTRVMAISQLHYFFYVTAMLDTPPEKLLRPPKK